VGSHHLAHLSFAVQEEVIRAGEHRELGAAAAGKVVDVGHGGELVAITDDDSPPCGNEEGGIRRE
jgi:hypothetical protein